MNRRSGFTISELLVTLSLLVMFFAAAGEMFRSTVVLDRDSETFSDHASRVDSAIFQLRQDVWNSRGIAAGDAHSIELTNSDERKIFWKTDSDGSVSRTDAAGVRRWDGIAGKWMLATDGIGVTISDGSAVPMRLPSQILMGGRSKP